MRHILFGVNFQVELRVLVGLASLASVGYAQTVTTFDAPNAGFTIATAINSAGQITGYYEDTIDQITRGFLREPDGTITTFDGPPLTLTYTSFTFARTINSAGQIAGSYFESSVPAGESRGHGFLRDRDGTITPFDIGTADHVLNTAINPAAQIAGSYVFSDLPSPTAAFLRQPDGSITTFYDHSGFTVFTAINPAGQITGYGGAIGAFLRQRSGSITAFHIPNSIYTYPVGINSTGRITGYYSDASYFYHGFLRQPGGTITTFDALNSSATLPQAINAASQIAGQYQDPNGRIHGFLRQRDGSITTIDVPSSTYTYPVGINSAGQITGYYFDGWAYHGFIFTS